MPDVAGYVRVSTEQQREQGSHERQRERLQKWADTNEHEIDIYEDIAISGQDDTRDDYRDLMGDPEEGELGSVTDYDIFIVRELSRFGRSLQQVTKDIERLHDEDVDFISLKEDLDMTSAQGKLMLHIIAAFNQFWSDWSRERAMEYVEQARNDDSKPLGRPKKIDDDLADKCKMFHDEGMSYATIARWLKIEKDVEVHRSTVKRTLDGMEKAEAD